MRLVPESLYRMIMKNSTQETHLDTLENQANNVEHTKKLPDDVKALLLQDLLRQISDKHEAIVKTPIPVENTKEKKDNEVIGIKEYLGPNYGTMRMQNIINFMESNAIKVDKLTSQVVLNENVLPGTNVHSPVLGFARAKFNFARAVGKIGQIWAKSGKIGQNRAKWGINERNTL